MLKISKTNRITNFVKVSEELAKDNNSLIKHYKRLSKLPKNTLKCVFKKYVIGYDGMDFIQNKITIAFYFEIIRFKRK